MGREIESVAGRRGHRLVTVVDRKVVERAGRRGANPEDLGGAEVAFEFTEPGSAEANVIALLRTGVAVVCGTTGWDAAGRRLKAVLRSSRAGIVFAPNFSLGMNVFYRIVGEASRALGAAGGYDPFIVETHHRGKADAPSGTARRLSRLLLETDPSLTGVREGNPPEALDRGEIHVASVRSGHESGIHTVGFDGEHDVIELTHRARGRSGFALGAVLAGEWLIGRRGMHGFDEVLGDLLDDASVSRSSARVRSEIAGGRRRARPPARRTGGTKGGRP